MKSIKTLIIIIIIVFLTFNAQATKRKRMHNRISDSLLNTLITIESNGDSTKIGKSGELGVLQIKQCVIDDVNNFVEKKKTYTIEDVLDEKKAREICKKYLTYWAYINPKSPHKLGKKVNNEILSKIWNGGPNGWKKSSTNDYWLNVKSLLNIA